MWDALDIGSAPIQVLEPGCGTGNFMAGIPENIKANVSGVELDPISARIAAALNPDATILNADLADCTIHPGFDLTIGNVPYSGDISLDYRTTDGGTSRLPLHDYFIERSVDALRPGGVAMLLTSRYTLDKRSETMRADLARKAELVGAVRLPSSTFARQAGTEAVTDVLVLRRRERTLDRTPDEAWIHSNPVAVPGYQDVTVNVNQAVANDMTAHAVGDIRPVIGRFGGDFDVVFQGDAEQVGERLQELLSTQITHGPALSLGEAEPAGRAEITVRPDHVAPFEYSVDQRGVVWYGDGTTVTEIAHGQGDEARRLRGMIRLRDLARELQRLELDPARVDDPDVEAKRAELDRAYDRFTSEFGRLCDRANQRAYSGEESGCHLVMALEETDEKGRFAGKAKCLSQRTISPVPPMPDHADSLDDALDISLDRAGGVDLELIARLADTTVEEAETGLGDRIIRDPDTGEVMPAEDYLAGDVGTKLDHVTAMAEHLRRRAAREAMTEFAASTYATSEDMPAIEQAREWIDTAGTDVWRSLTDPYAAESYRDPTPVIERINDGRHGWTMGWNRNPELVLALVWRAVEELPERHSRVTLERSDTGERKPWHAPAWHRSHGTSPLWDALCWTWRDGDAPQHYAPILADRRMPVRDLALFVHKIAHTDRLETADKTAILSNLFESYSAHDKHGSTIWTDTTIGAMARRLMPGTDDPTRLAERLATDMSVSEWIWGIARDLPDLRQGAAHDAYGAPPRAIDARPDDYQAFRARREEQLGQWREQPEHAEAARADQTDAERLEHVADLLERVQPTPLETEQIKAPLGAPWIPARDVHDFMMETFNVRGHGLTPGKLSQYSVDWIPQLGPMARRLLGRRRHRLQGSKDVRHRGPQPVPTAGGVPGQRADHRHQGLPHGDHGVRQAQTGQGPEGHDGRHREGQRDPRRVEPMGVQGPRPRAKAHRPVQPQIQRHAAPPRRRILPDHARHRPRRRPASASEGRGGPRPAQQRGDPHRARLTFDLSNKPSQGKKAGTNDRTFQHRQPARPDRQEHGHRPRQAHGTAGGRRKGTRRRAGDAGRTIRPRGRVPAKTGRTRTADVQTRRTPGDGK